MSPFENEVGPLILRFLACTTSAEQAAAALDLLRVGVGSGHTDTATLAWHSIVSAELAVAGSRAAIEGDDESALLLFGAARTAAARLPAGHGFRTKLVETAAAMARVVGEQKPAFFTVPGGEA